MDSNQPKRLYNISLLRVMAMASVVYYHCLCYYSWSPHEGYESVIRFSKFIVAINMPLFVFLSGYLYSYLRMDCKKYTDNRKFLIGKAKRLLMPYLCWCILLIVIFPSDYHEWRDMLTGMSHLWFLLMLFDVMLFFHFTSSRWMKTSKRTDILLFVGIVMLRLLLGKLTQQCTQNYLGLLSAITYMPYFALGILLQKHRVLSCLKPYAGLVSIGSAILLLLVIYFRDQIGAGRGTCEVALVVMLLMGIYYASEGMLTPPPIALS